MKKTALVVLGASLGLFVCVLAAPANAHLGLILPVSRYGPDVLKQGPCGVLNGERSDKVSVFEPGQTILVQWEEYIDHPGHYRIAFDSDGDDDFLDPASMDERYGNDTVLLDGIEDESETDPYYEVSVQLPNVECERCTLQVIQVMYDKPPYEVPGNDIYYQCADLALRCPAGPGECEEKGSPTGAGGAGGGAAGSGGIPAAVDCASEEASALGGAGGDGCKQGGACSLSPGPVNAAYAWQLAWTGLFVGLLYRRRRRRALSSS